MTRLGVSGGRQGRPAGAADRDHRPLYDLALFGVLDGDSWSEALRYVTTAAWLSGPVGHRFGAPSRDGDGVWLCTERELVRWPDGARVDHPWFADLHHVAVCPEGLLAVATGVGGVVDAAGGRFFAAHPRARAPATDVRCAPTHDDAHPNHVFVFRGRTYVTRGALGDCVPLGGGPATALADVVVHDGVPAADGVWFTGVDGRLVLADPERGAILRTVRVGDGTDGPLGWCRGLVVQGDVAFVGFTRLRATRLRRNLAWLRGKARGGSVVGERPTRVAEVSLADGRVRREVDLEAFGLHAVFGLCEVGEGA